MSKLWSFIVDTDSYSGNFEREMAGYIVGQFDEYGEHRGGPFQKLYLKELPNDPFQDLVDLRVNDGSYGCFLTPVIITPTPGYSNNGNGKHTKLKSGQKIKYPAYQSIAIFLTRKPTTKEFKVLSKRAKDFEKIPQFNGVLDSKRPKILGCRLIKDILSSENIFTTSFDH